jgi:pimeloyl-ACP methyl ester carboxylesterase
MLRGERFTIVIAWYGPPTASRPALDPSLGRIHRLMMRTDSQARARDDIRDVLTHLRIERAHIIGLSMGGFATLHFGLTYPARAKSLMIASSEQRSSRVLPRHF